MDQLFEMDRRGWLARALLLVGATATGGCDFAGLALADGKGALDKTKLALLTAVADTIMPATDTPGAAAAGVPAKLNGMLTSWASKESRTAIIDGLDKIEAAAQATHKKGFAALSEADRLAFLTAHDAAALKPVPAPPGAPKMNLFSPAAYVVDPGYLKLKSLIIALYYSSEAAMTKEMVYEHVPGTWQPSIKANEKTRPWASTGPF